MGASSPLRELLARDHRRSRKLLKGIKTALAEQQIGRARQMAEALNQDAGPHVHFEERFLFPALEPWLGPTCVLALAGAHREAAVEVQRLVESLRRRRRKQDEILRLLDSFHSKIALCDKVLAAIANLPVERQDELVAALERLRAEHVLLSGWEAESGRRNFDHAQG